MNYFNKVIRLLILFSFTGFILIGCATGDISPPEITFIQQYNVISPNGDGVQDNLVLDLAIKDEGSVVYWRFAIFNDKNFIVRVIASEGNLNELKKKLFVPDKSVNVPEKIIWDGRDENGDVVPDGKYTFTFIAMDNKKNITPENSRKGVVIVDTDKPEMKADIQDKIFNPKGNKNTLNFDVDIIKDKVDNVELKYIDFTVGDNAENKEQVWNVAIINAKGEVVKKFTFKDKGKKKISWDGKDEQGNVVPDGKYKIKLYSTDEGGNYWEDVIPDVVINTKETPVSIKSANGIFSPNGDGNKDTIDLAVDYPVKEGILNWELKIISSKNQEVRVLKGDGAPKSMIAFDGKDNDGNYLPEDSYKAVISLLYNNGNTPSGETDSFIVDVSPPDATISVSPEIFSPDGNGIEDELIILENGSKEDTDWTGSIYNEKGALVKKFTWKSLPPKKFSWDGKDENNKVCADGPYYYQLTCTDSAGNVFASPKYKATIFTQNTPVLITASLDFFSPNKDKIADAESFEVYANYSQDTKVREWTFKVLDKDGKVVYSLNKSGDVPKNLQWDGTDNNKNTAADGEYTASINIIFEAGTESTSTTKPFQLDNTPPEFTFTATPKYFSPDGDGENDQLTMQLTAKDISGIKSWKIIILSPLSNTEFITFEGKGEPSNPILWDGKSKKGELVESVEDYPVMIVLQDNVGNTI